MRLETSPDKSRAILAAMRDVAEAGTALTERDRVTLVSAGRWMLGLAEADVNSLPSSTPGILATALPEAALRREATRFLAIMPFVDGALDKAKIARVEDYAHTLGVADGCLDEIAEAAAGDLRGALAHMVRDNMDSILGKPFSGDVMAWMLPYQGDKADPALAERFRALSAKPEGSFGRAFLAFYEATATACQASPRRSTQRSACRTIPLTSSRATTRRRAASFWSRPSPPACIRAIRCRGTCCR